MKKRHLFVLLAAFGVASAWAQTSDSAAPAEDEDVIVETQSIELVRVSPELRAILLRDRRKEPPQQEAVPNFAIRTRNNKFVMSIGGQVKPILGYDLGNDLYNAPNGGIDFTTGSIPVPAQPGKKSAFFINPLNAYLDFTIVGFGGSKNQITAYFKIAMNGENHIAFFKRAYVSWRGITAGETATLFSDGEANQPATIDPQGPGGNVAGTAYAVSYQSPVWNGFNFAIGLEKPTFYSSNGVYRGHDYSHDFFDVKVSDEANQLVPDIPMYVQYQASESNRIRLSGIIRNFAYRDLIDARTRHLTGWGVQMSGNFSFYKPLVFNFQAVYGKGIASYIQDLSGREISFTPCNSEVGRMESNPMMGLTFGASIQATKKLQFNLVGSYTRIWDVGNYAVLGDDAGVAGNNNFRYSIYATANCFYEFTNYIKWGIEYNFGRHATYGLGAANDSRIQTQLVFSF